MRRLKTLTRPIRLLTAVALAGALAFTSSPTMAVTQADLGTAANYAVVAGTTITNTGPTVVTSNLALSPGSAVTGFPPGIVNGETDIADADAVLAKTDLTAAYILAASEPMTVNLTGQNLGGLTLTPGTYKFDSSAQLTGALVLDGQGNTNASFVFQMGSTLTTASNSTVSLINGAGACAVFWQVGSSATLGTNTSFQGTIMALTSITMNTGANLGVGGLNHGGRALAINGAVTLDQNIITAPADDCAFAAAPTPTPVPTAVPTAVPTPIGTVAPTTAPSGAPSTAPSSPASSDSPIAIVASPVPGSTGRSTPTPVITIPVFNVPGISLFPGLPGVPGTPDVPNTSMATPIGTATPTVALLALAGLAVLGLSMKVATSRRRG